MRVIEGERCSGETAVSLPAGEFRSEGASLELSTGSSATYTLVALDEAGNASACSEPITYRVSSPPPDPETTAAPTLLDATPDSPSSNPSPRLLGTAPAASQVRIYRADDCDGQVIASGAATEFADPGLSVPAAENQTNAFSATAQGPDELESDCSAPIYYVHDSIAPQTVTDLTTDPTSPSPERSFAILGEIEDDVDTVRVLRGDSCQGSVAAEVSAEEFRTSGAPVEVSTGDSGLFSLQALDEAGNASACSEPITYRVSSPPPDPETTAAPLLGGWPSGSPSNQSSPKLTGSAPAGSWIRIYRGEECSGTEVASGTAEELAGAGIEVSADPNATSTFVATAQGEDESVSPCSAPISYEHDSVAPQTSIKRVKNGHSVRISASEPGSRLRCRLDERRWRPCARRMRLPSAGAGRHKFSARAIDAAGNRDPRPASVRFTVRKRRR